MPNAEFFMFAVPAVLIVGLGKGGFSGLGALGTPLMAIGMDDPVRAAAILLPILIAQDLVGVFAFWKKWDRAVLSAMLPGAVLGISAGYLLAARVSAPVIMALLGAVTMLFGVHRLWIELGGRSTAPSDSPPWVGSIFGMASGFTSQIAHAGGPPFQMWVMPKKLARDTFVGTSVIFFAVVNWIKVPAYAALGEFTSDNILASVMLLPAAIFGSLAGIRLVRIVPMERFYFIIYILLILTGAKLLVDGLAY